MNNTVNHKQVAHGVVEFNIQPSNHAAETVSTPEPVAQAQTSHTISTGPAPEPVVQHVTGSVASDDEVTAEE